MWISRKRKLHDYLAANNVELIKALIKVVNYPHTSRMSGLILQIHNAAYVCPSSKGRPKWISSKWIYSCLSEDNNLIESLIPLAEEEMCPSLEKPIVIPKSYVIAAIEEYQRWLADELVMHGVVTRKDVIEAITELLIQVSKVTSQYNR